MEQQDSHVKQINNVEKVSDTIPHMKNFLKNYIGFYVTYVLLFLIIFIVSSYFTEIESGQKFTQMDFVILFSAIGLINTFVGISSIYIVSRLCSKQLPTIYISILAGASTITALLINDFFEIFYPGGLLSEFIIVMVFSCLSIFFGNGDKNDD